MRRTAVAALGVSLALAGCGAEGGSGGGGDLRIVATTTEVGDLVRQVGGDRVRLTTLLAAEADPHDYEPTASDARAVADARVVFRSGGEVDEWLEDVIANAGGAAEEVDLIDSVEPLEQEGELDPHWWQDPRNAVRAVAAIRRALAGADPAGEAAFARRAAAYTRRLRRLDRRIARCLAAVPRSERKIVTTHDALGYFARRYGIEVVGALIPSLSTQAQPSARDIERLVDQIRAEKVRAVFPESALNPKLEQAVARESGARVGRALWADSLGKPGSTGATYVAALSSNADALVRGMTGGRRSCAPE